MWSKENCPVNAWADAFRSTGDRDATIGDAANERPDSANYSGADLAQGRNWARLAARWQSAPTCRRTMQLGHELLPAHSAPTPDS